MRALSKLAIALAMAAVAGSALAQVGGPWGGSPGYGGGPWGGGPRAGGPGYGRYGPYNDYYGYGRGCRRSGRVTGSFRFGGGSNLDGGGWGNNRRNNGWW